MSTDPIPPAEHRRRANDWLAEACDALEESSTHAPHAQAAATIAVAHALLAIATPQETDR